MQPESSVSRLGWKILFCWLAISIPMAYFIWPFVEPTYEASSILRVEPFPPKLFEPLREDVPDPRIAEAYLRTQVELITSNRVLQVAIANPLVVKLPVIETSEDPTADLRKKIRVEIVKEAYLIRVALELPNAEHAATIINAVVDSYLEYHAEYQHGANSQLKASLAAQLGILQKECESKTRELRALRQNGAAQSPQAIDDLKIRVGTVAKAKEDQATPHEESTIEEKPVNGDTLEAALLTQQASSLQRSAAKVKANLAQLEFEASQESFRVAQVDRASIPKTATNNRMLVSMAAAPFAVLFALIGLFSISEIKAKKVYSPVALSKLLQSEVYTLPPLPQLQSTSNSSAAAGDDQIKQFVQKIDYVRFAYCRKRAELGSSRTLLITSAVHFEGKSTLAAQLAARCGIAGTPTLLIDADICRESPGVPLDVPPGQGLSDVLSDLAVIEEVIVPVQGGLFYFLPAGMQVKNSSRLVQPAKIGVLMEQLQRLFDLIIIDSPPVLPTPDVLILCEHVDTVILAARHGYSRYPLVAQAKHKLAATGVPSIGVVLNGYRQKNLG